MLDEADYINDHLFIPQNDADNLPADVLVEQSFLAWYSLLEGIELKNFSEEDITGILKQNYNIYKEKYRHHKDLTFIFGWILNVAPWYVDFSIDPTVGFGLLQEAYEASRENPLFRWAIRDQIKLDETDKLILLVKLGTNFLEYYNHGELIKNYFLRIF